MSNRLIQPLAKRLRRQDGQAMVEFALVLPVLMTIVLGIFYFGEFLNYSTDETHLAAEAVRFAAVNNNPGSGTLQAYIASQATSGLQTTSSDVTTPVAVYIYYPSGSSGAVGSAVTACVTASVHFISFLGIAPETITQSVTMRLEQTASKWTPSSSHPSSCPT